jgi:hypothetical protein
MDTSTPREKHKLYRAQCAELVQVSRRLLPHQCVGIPLKIKIKKILAVLADVFKYKCEFSKDPQLCWCE